MTLDNKLNISDSADLARVEERISQKKALGLFESGRLNEMDAESFGALKDIHKALFEDLYDFAGVVRSVNISI